MQQQNQSKGNQKNVKKIAQIIFPAPYPQYENNIYDEIQYAQIDQSNKIPFFFFRNDQADKYIIYFHGNGEDLQGSYFITKKCAQYLKAHFILVEYPGYGLYTDTITTTEQIEKDALTVYDYIKSKLEINDNQIYAFGRSIGTGPAFYIGANRDCAGLIIFCAYLTLHQLVQDIVPHKAKFLENETNLNNQQNSQNARCKLLLIQGRLDQLTKLEHIEKLYENLPAQIKERSLLQIQDEMTHNDFSIKADIVDPIISFYPELKRIDNEDESLQQISQ